MSETVGDQFKGLDMHSLIAEPLMVACEAQSMLAASTTKFIQDAGLEKAKDGKSEIKTTAFSFQRGLLGENGENIGTQTVNMEVPLLAIVKIPTLAIDDINVTFDMDVTSVECSEKSSDQGGTRAENARIGFGPFSAKVNIKGSVASHEKNTRSTDNAKKYQVSVEAKDAGIPEGLERMLEILANASSTTPWKMTNNTENPEISGKGGTETDAE